LSKYFSFDYLGQEYTVSSIKESYNEYILSSNSCFLGKLSIIRGAEGLECKALDSSLIKEVNDYFKFIDANNTVKYVFDFVKTHFSCKELSEISFNSLDKEFSSLEEGCDFIDNYRFCVVGNIQQEYFFTLQASKGCCGVQQKAVMINGVKCKIGFNFGH
jgi:hypothetical protein